MKCEKCGKEMYITTWQDRLCGAKVDHVCLECDFAYEEPSDLDKLKAVLDDIGVTCEIVSPTGYPRQFIQIYSNGCVSVDYWEKADLSSDRIKFIFDKEGKLVK